MPGIGRQHFEEYLPQTEAKHAILENYFKAYLTSLGPRVEAFHYIDGFAGRGTYGDGNPGSALIALAALAAQPKPATISLVESDKACFDDLRTTVAPRSLQVCDPLLSNSAFEEVLPDLVRRPIYAKYRRVATFAFIDPCGVRSVRMRDIGRLLELPFGECLLFWNYEGLNRWLGGVSSETLGRDNLVEFFGGVDACEAALSCFRRTSDAGRREIELRDLYIGSLRDVAGARFIIPFRFRSRRKVGTSHYLIHCATHQLAFKIMKEVMRNAATRTDGAVEFEFLHADELGVQTALFRPSVDRARSAILDELRKGVRPVGLFADAWVLRPDDFLVTQQYKEILTELEREGLIEILDPATARLLPASARRTTVGRPTLASRLLARIGPNA
jgi:three-Cys-motif partner protein